jgi:hypothetical protein
MAKVNELHNSPPYTISERRENVEEVKIDTGNADLALPPKSVHGITVCRRHTEVQSKKFLHPHRLDEVLIGR